MASASLMTPKVSDLNKQVGLQDILIAEGG
jgi:hypothetical protein